MAKTNTLTTSEQRLINEINSIFTLQVKALEEAQKFQVGDYLIAYYTDYEGKTHLKKNSYGAPIKFIVVSSTDNGIPFMKKVNKNGKPFGDLIRYDGYLGPDDYITPTMHASKWELDPDYADALLLQQEYDPALLHKNKKQIWKEVTDHNKSCKVVTDKIAAVVDFFKTVKIGDTLWTSNNSHYLVRDIQQLSKADANKFIKPTHKSKVKGPFVLVLQVVDKKGIVRDIAADFFHNKALYKERPRTYKELNI